jgi:TRAP transporter TAXI family solute receptor
MSIRIGTNERGGTFYTQGLALKTVLDRVGALVPVQVLESAQASIDNANRLNAGELDFGFMASNWLGRARLGEAPFTQPIDLRMASPVNAGPLFFIARADSTLRTVADLRGRRVAVGPRGSGMTQHAHCIFGALGLDFAGFTPLYLDFAAGADALAAGEADAQLQCPVPNQVMTDLAARIAVRVLPYGPGQLDAVLKAVPYYRRTVMKTGAVRGLDADVAQIAVINVLVTHARCTGATVQAVVRAIVSGAGELGRINPLYTGLDDLLRLLRSEGPAAIEFGGVALHPGALRAYREAGLLVKP